MKINMDKLPRHIAFIMDGNGRWANRRGLPRKFGYKVGYDKMKTVVKRCSELGIEVCSFYAFSTENWNRPQEELDEIFRLIRENMEKDMPLFNEWNVRVMTMGDVTKFPQDLQDALSKVKEDTKNNTGCVMNLGVNYGGQAELTRAVNQIIESKVKSVTEKDIEQNLYTANLPRLDLLVRTSGEQRVSNFMLWQMAYSEFLFIKKFWPDMSGKTVDKCIVAFQKRKRRFGKI